MRKIRFLKQGLAVLLSLSMSLGPCAPGSFAAYADSAEISAEIEADIDEEETSTEEEERSTEEEETSTGEEETETEESETGTEESETGTGEAAGSGEEDEIQEEAAGDSAPANDSKGEEDFGDDTAKEDANDNTTEEDANNDTAEQDPDDDTAEDLEEEVPDQGAEDGTSDGEEVSASGSEENETESEAETGDKTNESRRVIQAEADEAIISVIYDDGVFPENVTLEVRKVDEESEEQEAIREKAEKTLDFDGTAEESPSEVCLSTFEIKVLDENEEEVTPDTEKGEMFVRFDRITIPEADDIQHDPEDIQVLTIEDLDEDAFKILKKADILEDGDLFMTEEGTVINDVKNETASLFPVTVKANGLGIFVIAIAAKKEMILEQKLQQAAGDTVYWGIDNNNRLVISADPVEDTSVAGGSFSASNSSDTDYDQIPWNNYRDIIESVVVGSRDRQVRPGSVKFWFNDCVSIKTMDLSGLDTSKVTDMRAMFHGCESLTSLDLSYFNTSNVTDMGSMFNGCSSLTTLNLTGFDTSNVTDMGWMFWCSGLISLDLSHFNTSNVTDMNAMFYYCDRLTTLNLTGFDTSNLTDTVWMFKGCKALTSLDVSGFDTSNVTDMHSMFDDCESLTSLELSNFNTSNVHDMEKMFSGCESLTSLDLSNFNTSKVWNMDRMFGFCSSLTSLDLSNFNITNVEYAQEVFRECNSLRILHAPAAAGGISIPLPSEMYDADGNGYSYISAETNGKRLARFNSDENTVFFGTDKDNPDQPNRRQFDHDLTYYVMNASSTEYDPDLALMLICLASAAYNQGGDDPNKPSSNLINSLNSMGFDTSEEGAKYYYYDANAWNEEDENSVAYAITKKTASDGTTIIPVILRGSSGDILYLKENGYKSISNLYGGLFEYDLKTSDDWYGNIAFKNEPGPHYSFNYAADKVFEALEDYLAETDSNNYKIVITGHSRAAAVGNLLAYKLRNAGYSKDSVYAYNFACPDSARQKLAAFNPDSTWGSYVTGEENEGRYDNIFNICNIKDPVGQIPGDIFTLYADVMEHLSGVREHYFWGKYGRTYYFSEDWTSRSGTHINFDYHASEKYIEIMDRLSEERTFKTRFMAAKQIHEGIDDFGASEGTLLVFYCPVDITIIDSSGEEIVKVINGEPLVKKDYADKVLINIVDDEKQIFIFDDDLYTVKMTGTDTGTMDYGVYKIGSEQLSYIQKKEFSDVLLSGGKKMISEVNQEETYESVPLYVFNENNDPVYVVSEDGSETPVDTVPVSMINVDQDKLEIEEGEAHKLNAVVFPTFATNKNVLWTSSNNDIASVDPDGTVVAVKAGTAVVTATSEDGEKTASCLVTVRSSDPVEAFIRRLYTICLGREADDGGLNYWKGRINSGSIKGIALAGSFVFSNEFTTKNYCSEHFVRQIYPALMGREPDEEGFAYWVGELDKGMKRETLLNRFTSSNEYKNLCAEAGIELGAKLNVPQYGRQPYGPCAVCGYKSKVVQFVERMYTECLKREAEEGGLTYWSRELCNHTKTGKTLLDNFFLSQEIKNKNLSNEEYVCRIYRAMLNRDPDDEGLVYWTGRLNKGESATVIIAGFVGSAEFTKICQDYGIQRK